MDAVSPTQNQGTQLDDVLAEYMSVLAADGYDSRWEVDEGGRLHFHIIATDTACAECLVPKVVLESILEAALEGTGYELAEVRLPTEAA